MDLHDKEGLNLIHKKQWFEHIGNTPAIGYDPRKRL